MMNMMTYIQTFKTFFLSLIFIVSFTQAKATHALGGDLMYEQLSPTEFEVTLRLYRDCNGIAMSSYAEIFWDGSCGSGSDFAFRNNLTDITPICPTMETSCQGGSGITGIEEHIYTTIITVPSGCSDLRFDYSLCCRNQVITTLIFPTNEYIFLSAKHENVSNLINSSPVFNNNPAPIVSVNKPVVYNHGVFDTDGDSLYFSLSDCYEGYNDPVEYFPGFSGTNPLTTSNGVYIDHRTGAISFTPTVQQIGVMCVKVEEFRSGIKIGEVIRDIQFNVISASNDSPIASGIDKTSSTNSTNFVIDVCENGQVCFDLSFSDSNSDNLTVTWNQEIPTGSFQVVNNNTTTPEATFCWTPQSTDLGLNYFSVNVVDDACPIVGTSTYTYIVNVKSNADNIVQNVLTDTTLCVENENELFFELVGEEITWSDGTQGQYLYPTNTGTYIVTYEDINTSCLVSDTMEIEIVDCNEDSDTVVVDDVDEVDGVVVEHDVNTEYEVDIDNIKDEVYIEDIKEEINSEEDEDEYDIEDVDEEYVVEDEYDIEDEYNVEECVVVLPSGFSPNFDGVNDIFRTIIKCEEDLSYYHLTIYDRWGNLVFASNNPTEGWDGSIHQFNQSNVGVYIYNLSYSFTSSDTMERLNGTLTLIN